MTNAVNIAQSGSNNQTMRNRIINGAMVIDQRNAGASLAVTSTGQYSVDRFRADIFSSATGRFSIQQSTAAPAGFVNSLLVTVTTANASPTAAFGYSVQQMVEGFNLADLAWGTANAQPATLSFWVRSSITGTFPAIIQNSDGDRAFGAQYTISAANTWEYKTVAISGITSGTWLTNNGIGARVLFGLGGGTDRTISTGFQTVPSAGTQTNVTGSTNLLATNGATWQITGVQLEEGTAASPFENRLYGTELLLCQRYYYRLLGNSAYEGIGNGYAISYSSTQCQGPFVMPVKLRVSPSLSYSSNLKVSDVYSYSRSVSSMSVSAVNNGTDCAYIDIVSSSLSTGRVHYLGADNSTSAFVAFVAEL
jgi:hypothetical protein